MQQFWERRQQKAGSRPYAGYLADESPAVIGRKRFEGERAQVRRWLKTMVPGRQRCLDLGCGTGEWSVEFAKHFAQVDGLDWAQSMVRQSRAKARQAGLRHCHFRRGEITGIRGKSLYDFIFIGGVLMYATDAMVPKIFKRAAALLKPGGVLLVRESTRPGPTLYRRDYSLRPGLLAVEEPRPDYAAVYRDAVAYEQALQGAGLKLRLRKPNRFYKFTDLAEDHLRRLDRLGLGLSKNPKRADFLARLIFASAWISLWPAWLWSQYPLQNEWFAAGKR